MPYIVTEKRDTLDEHIDSLLNALRGLECDDSTNNMAGNLNYVMTRLLHRVYPGNSYREVNDAMGLLSSCQAEYYRKRAAPLEDQKCWDNGDVL